MKFKMLTILFVGGLFSAAGFKCSSGHQASQRQTDWAPDAVFVPQEGCLTIDEAVRPEWECYDLETTLAPGAVVTITHESGIAHFSTVFRRGHANFFRFTPSAQGEWNSTDGQSLKVDSPRPAYAHGFVINQSGKWARSATGQVFVPQYVMYDGGDPAAAINEFVVGHGFTGLHIPNLRHFARFPEYFEEVVLKTYRAGGSTHFWIWGDEQRRLTPAHYPNAVDDAGSVTELYELIAARLGPLPGWTVGFGFDLFEWLDEEDVDAYRDVMRQRTSYEHMLGARGFKNRYQTVIENADYASWEWHRPGYDDYLDHVERAGGIPAFSEDRFRIRDSIQHAAKDYDEALTVAGLWDSLLAGGVANIWGNAFDDGSFSQGYDSKESISRYRQFVDEYFRVESQPVRSEAENAHCLVSLEKVLCRYANTDRIDIGSHLRELPLISIELMDMESNQTIFLQDYRTIIELPRQGDWILAISFGAN